MSKVVQSLTISPELNKQKIEKKISEATIKHEKQLSEILRGIMKLVNADVEELEEVRVQKSTKHKENTIQEKKELFVININKNTFKFSQQLKHDDIQII